MLLGTGDLEQHSRCATSGAAKPVKTIVRNVLLTDFEVVRKFSNTTFIISAPRGCQFSPKPIALNKISLCEISSSFCGVCHSIISYWFQVDFQAGGPLTHPKRRFGVTISTQFQSSALRALA
ncbi:hypothetical protein ASD00_36330 [Ensifer sp. Root31]|nr:hypothetical protein ASD00_36330 [Ensifer sp. Root31]